MGVLKDIEIELTPIKQATKEFDIEHYFDSLFDKLNLQYQAQHRVLQGRPDCLIGDVIIDFKYSISTTELTNWVQSKGKQYIDEYFATRGKNPSLLIVISEKDIYYYDTSLLLQNKRNIDKKTIKSLIECLLEPAIVDSEQFAMLFGVNSPLYILAYSRLEEHFDRKDAERQSVCYQQWKKNFSLAYHDEDVGKELFLRHSYLSMLLKLILYKEFMESEEYSRDYFKDLENFFELLGISLFHYDFFRWVINVEGLCDNFFEKIKLMSFKATDIFRVIYQEMIIAGVRHQLGEYYTPEPLCHKMVEKEYKVGDRVLDSSCGSGTFLIEILKKIDLHFGLQEDQEPPEEWYDAVNNIFGFDINPIAILTSKANILLYLKSKRQYIENISINVYLCNSINPLKFAPTADIELGRYYSFCVDLLEAEMELRIPGEVLNKENISIFQQVVRGVYKVWEDFEKFEDAWEATLNEIRVKNDDSFLEKESQITLQISQFFKKLFELKAQDKDHIWLYILNNLVGIRILLLKKKMDLIMTNPPWLTYKDADETLRNDLKKLSEQFRIKPGAHNVTNIEEAVVFLYKIPDLYLRRDGKGRIAFVMPRSLLVSSQNQKARRFDYFKDLEFFTFNDLVFNIECCCVFASFITDVPTKKDVFKKYPIKSTYFDATSFEIIDTYNLEPYVYFQEKHGAKYLVKRLIKTEKKDKLLPCALSDYYTDFIQGADMLPKSLLYVEIINTLQNGRISVIDPWMSPQAKGVWKQRHFSNVKVESNLLFKATLSRKLYPFYIEPYDIFLPFNEELEFDTKNIGPFSRKHWNNIKKIFKKENKKDLFDVGINYRNKLCKDNKVREEQRKPYKVVFPNAKKLMAAVIEDPKGHIFIDSTLYYYGTDDKQEAYYICGMLNIAELSRSTKVISDTRHHHKRPLYFNIPKFVRLKEQKEISSLAQESSKIVKKYCNTTTKPKMSKIRELLKENYQNLENLGLDILKSEEGIKVIKEYLYN